MTITPAELDALIDRVIEARAHHLVDRPVDEIVAAIDRVAARFLREGDPLRAEAIQGVHSATGHSPAMARLIVDGMAADWRAGPLRCLLAAEFGDPGALDRFVARADGRRSRAFGPSLTMHVFSGNVPGVSVTSLIRALLVKSASVGKTAAAEPVMAPLFVRALAEEDPGLGECVAITRWRGGDEALEAVALARADAVIVYGSGETVRSLRERTPPGTRFLGYPHRISFGVVAREALTDEGTARQLAEDAALAVATFDQRGCVSPQLVYVETGGSISPEAWATLLAAELDRLESELPRGAVTAEEAAAIRQLRARAEFAELAGSGVRLHASADGTAWTVVYDPDPGFGASCLNRTVSVRPVTSIDEIPGLVAAASTVLQTVAFAGPADRRERFAGNIGALGASRVTSFRRMPWPAPSWHHDGRPPLGDLVRWCDVE